jgi:glutamine amidotransferase
VHSYALTAADPADLLATADYGGAVVAAIARGNVAGTQFHPEKSQETGLRFLANFLRWQPAAQPPAEAPADSGKTVLTGP